MKAEKTQPKLNAGHILIAFSIGVLVTLAFNFFSAGFSFGQGFIGAQVSTNEEGEQTIQRVIYGIPEQTSLAKNNFEIYFPGIDFEVVLNANVDNPELVEETILGLVKKEVNILDDTDTVYFSSEDVFLTFKTLLDNDVAPADLAKLTRDLVKGGMILVGDKSEVYPHGVAIAFVENYTEKNSLAYFENNELVRSGSAELAKAISEDLAKLELYALPIEDVFSYPVKTDY